MRISSRESSLFEGEVEERRDEGGGDGTRENSSYFLLSLSVFLFILGIMKASLEFVPEMLQLIMRTAA